jgi:hypothetical protein
VAAQRALINRYCVTCHNERLQTAGLTLDRFDLGEVGKHAEVWEKVARKLRAGAMPPAGSPRPDKAEQEAFVGWLEGTLDRSVAADTRWNRPIVHRLNRLEYTNAIRDLLTLDVAGSSLLPTDESGYGFDNIADVLSVTTALLERYLIAAQQISRLAVGDPTLPSSHERFGIRKFIVQSERVSDDLPFMSRGGSALRHAFPLDGEYVLRIRLRRAFDGGVIKGIETPQQLDVRLDGQRIKLFNIGGECVNSKEPKCVKSMAGFVLPSSEYDRTADAALEVRFAAKAGPRLIGVAFANRNVAIEGAGAGRLPQMSTASAQVGEMGVDSVDLEGPLNVTGPGDTPSRRQIFICRPKDAADEEPCAKKILSALAHRAYRGRATAGDVTELVEFFRAGRNGGSFDRGIQYALEKLLLAPKFLLRIDGVPSKGQATNRVSTVSLPAVVRLSDLEVASRLSFFLWSSIPDNELLDVAARGQLRNASVLEQQVRRMLADSRATSLVSNFASQWLYLRDLRKAVPDPRVFPDFDDSLRDAFEQETMLFLESQLRENRPLIELLTADYTFVNERLARFYGMTNVYGAHFRRVPSAPHRAGLLGHASLLTVTSYSTRTSPVVRGKYLLSNILGSPPPPPPPNVEALGEPTEGQVRPTMRERMETHRKNAVCASCHSRMDPLGFALENFNAIGKWRVSDGEAVIDPSGVFPGGPKFSNPTEFRQLLLGQRDEFVRTFTEKLLTYALGRGLEYHDMPAVRNVVRDAALSDYRWTELIMGVVKSAPFQMAAPRLEDSEVQRAN